VALPIIPHEFFGVDCCGCLVEIVGVDTQFRCNECDAVIVPEDVQRAVMEIGSTEATCPHCGEVNQISGFASVNAFVCVRCRCGVGL
jgi:phage FluMu protein Com